MNLISGIALFQELYLSDEDERNAFDVEKYLEHKLVFSQDTEFEVYEVNVTEEDVKEAEQNIS